MPQTPLQEKRSVLQILEAFKGTAPLRELLAQLNYDPLNEPVSRKDWPEAAQAALAADPRLLGSTAGEFYVIYAQLASDRLKLTDERAVIPQLLKQYPYTLFVFSNKSQSDFHFVNVKWESTAKRRLYRRIAVGPQERLRTAVERIDMLDPQKIDTGLFGLSAQQVQDRHDEAFDVAKVTKDFYEEYKRVFEVMRDAVKGFGQSDAEQDRRHLFTQRLFNRLMFLRFIQKKGWLTIDGSTDYLAALWTSHGKLKQEGKNFYGDRLKLLFAALDDERASEAIFRGGRGAVEATIGKVKYLNGGLFEPTAEDEDPKVRIADMPFKQIFDQASGLFERFNFTITESTPLDVEIAVDPEMLGKIFEELVTGRHDSGSYYTPKPIVSFMCREALKGYLETQVPGEDNSALAQFVDHHEPKDIRNAEAVLEALKRVTVCDPACGSGAYLLGMMHELLDLRQCLFQTRQVDNKTMYQRKLDVIQTNIYGVDIAEFAVNIARLRLWLSLAVDYDGPEPEPLPNLDYKIEVGDSVCSPSPGALQIGLQQPLVDEFLSLKKQYLLAHHGDKSVLRSQVEDLRSQIMAFSNRDAKGFDWVIDFAEVFADDGFNVVIANPPYVRMELLKEQKPHLRHLFPTIHAERADLYCYFYGRAVELLRNGGMLSFISPNKWFRAQYGAPLRGYLADKCEISSITDFGELPVFEAATFPMIFVAKKGKSQAISAVLTQVRTLTPPYPNILELLKTEGCALPAGALTGRNWNLSVGAAASTLVKLKRAGIPLVEYVSGEIFYGIKSGFNKAFIIDSSIRKELIRDCPACLDVIKPFLVGDSIRKWKATDFDSYLLYMHHGIDVSGLKPILSYMKGFRSKLEARATKQQWYELQQPQFRYAQSFESPKIVFPDIAKSPRFMLDTSGCFVDTTGFVIPKNDLYLLGVLNSRCVWHYLSETAAVLGDPNKGGRLRLKRMYVESIPIPTADNATKAKIANLAKKCIENTQDREPFEHQLEQLVAQLFSIDLEEIGGEA